ncbi:MAG: response regulator [Deltaproteobacteria bacterium]|nr:response regulator [Deltaproteobacteria bacterium]
MASILIIDDQSGVRQLISEELILEGHQVRSLGDTKSAREHLQRSRPDLVLLDLYLDGPEGFGVLEDIKYRHPEVPVIVLTAYDGFAGDPRLSGADGYVVKNCDLTELKSRIADILESELSVDEEMTP